MSKEQTPEYKLWEKYGTTQKKKSVLIGPHSSYQFINSRRHLLFTASRYKFAMKMLDNQGQGSPKILDLGCSDGFGTHFLAENASEVVGVDFDQETIEFAQNDESINYIKFICDDFLGKIYGHFDGIVSFDVIEHIYPENVDRYMETVLNNLNSAGAFIVGTPSMESQKHSKENVSGAHVNIYTGESLNIMLKKYFHNVFMFTQNDEIIHTGHFRMANYLLAVCCNQK